MSETFSKGQNMRKNARPVYYSGEQMNFDPDVARDIITLYVTCAIGYSAIRHIIGLKNDKRIEDVICQHNLGRRYEEEHPGQLLCPGRSAIGDIEQSIIYQMVHKYMTADDPYVVEMLKTRRWSDDPAYASKVRVCPKCGMELAPEWRGCPVCLV